MNRYSLRFAFAKPVSQEELRPSMDLPCALPVTAPQHRPGGPSSLSPLPYFGAGFVAWWPAAAAALQSCGLSYQNPRNPQKPQVQASRASERTPPGG